MRRDKIIEVLKRNEAAIRALGVGALYLYGSHARDEAQSDSDVDVFFDKNPDQKLSLFELIDLQFMLKDILGTKVDVGTRSSLHPVLKAEIERSAVQVF